MKLTSCLTMDESLQEYKEKYENSERNLQNLKDLAHKAIADYEDLQKKYDQNYKQYEVVRSQLEECEAKLQQVTKLIQPAYEEYNELEAKFTIEAQLKNEAERFATKMTQQNNKLKRQSQMLLDMVNDSGVSVTELETITQEDAEEETDKESSEDHYTKIIEELRDKLAETEAKYKTAEEEREAAKQQELMWKNKYEFEQTQTKVVQSNLEKHKSSLNQFKRVSTMAYKEYEDLKSKYELEQELKNEAMKFASTVLSQKNAIQRQSVAAITEAAGDSTVQKAFAEIEELSKTLELERQENKKKIAELERDLDKSNSAQTVDSLQEQLDAYDVQVKDLKTQLKDITLWRDKLDKENKELTDKLDVAEQKLRPPPPPPPPPLPAILKPIAKMIKKKKSGANKGNSSGAKGDPAFNSALQEMMDRIKKGDIRGSLKPTNRRPGMERSSSDEKIFDRSPSMPEEAPQNSSMNELHNLLSNLKRSKSVDSGKSINNNSESETNELLRTFNKVRGGDKPLSDIIEDEDGNKNTKENE